MPVTPLPEVTMDDVSRFVQQYIEELCATQVKLDSSGDREFSRVGAYAELQRMLVQTAPRSHKTLARAMIESAAVKHLAERHSFAMRDLRERRTKL